MELFKLAGVEVDAVELAAGATVSAAKAVSLGSLVVLGAGVSAIPGVLFGEPALLVGCLPAPPGRPGDAGDDDRVA